MKSIKLGLLQTKVVADNNQNYSNIENMIRTTTQNDNVDIFLLPEHWYYMDAHSKDFLKNIQEKPVILPVLPKHVRKIQYSFDFRSNLGK